MPPLIIVAVGYITGFIWGLYFKISIVPIIFLFLLGLIFIPQKPYKLYIIISVIFLIFGNYQVKYLENKFEKLYCDLGEIEVTGIIVSNKEETQYKNSYVLKVESINKDSKYKNTNLIVYTKKDIDIEYGKKVSFIR